MNSDLIIEFNDAEFAVNLLTLILATSVGARIKTRGLSDELQPCWRTYKTN